MDKTRFTANRRLELVDLTRQITGIEELTQNYILARLFGDPEYYAGVGGNHTINRAAVIMGPYIDNPGAPSLDITVYNGYSDGTHMWYPIMWDKDGNRIAGPRAALTKSMTVSAGAGTKFIVARRVADDTTNESRQHYSAAAGKYAANVDTETIDEWEIDESATSAATTNALMVNGWVDIGRVTVAGGVITVVNDYSIDPSTTLIPSLLNAGWQTWAGGTTPDRRPVNFLELLTSIQQILANVRGRTTYDVRPTHDARFEPEGGVRFGSGESAAAGVQDTYWRALDAGYDLLTAMPNTAADANALHYVRALGFIAGGIAGNEINPANSIGFCYGNTKNAKTPVTIDKWWSLDASGMLPAPKASGNSSDPWNVTTTNEWYLGTVAGTEGEEYQAVATPGQDYNLGWRININVVSAQELELGLYMPLTLPDGCRIMEARLNIGVDAGGMDTNHRIWLWIMRRAHDNAHSGTVECINAANPTQTRFGGATGAQYISEAVSATPSIYTVDNENWAYYCVLNHVLVGVGTTTDKIRVCDLHIKTRIREASHVY